MFGINGGEFVVLLVVIALVVGPQRLPEYAEQLAHLVKSARGQLKDLRNNLNEEFGVDGEPVDWSTLDPRRYDPRRIVRDALADEPEVPVRAGSVGVGAAATGAMPERGTTVRLAAGEPAPYDDEAT